MNADEMIKRGEEYRQMTETPGWKDLERTLMQAIEGAKKQWLESDGISDDVKVYAKAYHRVLQLVKNRIDLGKKKAAEKDRKPTQKARARKRKIPV